MDKNGSNVPFAQKEYRVKGSEIFIGGLVRSVTENEIRELFSPFGQIVELRMIKDQNGASKGFCFVRFVTKEAAYNAQKEKDGAMIQGKKIGVALSSDQSLLFFGNLRKEWSSEEFDKLVRQSFKDVVSVELAMPPESGNYPAGKKRLNRGFAFVQFSSHAVSRAAARAHRLGSKSDFKLDGDWHPVIDWAEKEKELDPEEMAKIKVAFVGNLPTNAEEDFLKQLFEPLGKVERVALSRKGQAPVGFVHFATRSDLDKAMKEMDGKMVQGPNNGPKFKIQVSVAKPVGKDRKRVRGEETKSKPLASGSSVTLSDHTHDLLGHKAKAPRVEILDVDVADSYEAAVVALPSTVKERLLRIFRLGLATRYDVDIRCIISLKELPEAAAITILDQFMLSGADKHDKGAYFSSLVAKHDIRKLGSSSNPLHIPKVTAGFAATKDSEFRSLHAPVPRVATDFTTKDTEYQSLQAPLRAHAAGSRYSSYIPSSELYPFRSSLLDVESGSYVGGPRDPLSSYRFPISSSLMESELSIAMLRGPLPSYVSPVSSGGYRTGPGSALASNLPSSGHSPLEQPQIKFDPYTGQPYKFDPFTGEPIQPETHAGRSANFM